MTEQEALTILRGAGAVIADSHIVYTSGKHGTAYVNKDALYPYITSTSRLCWAMAHQFRNAGVEAVVAPAVGGVILSQWVAHHLAQMTERRVLAIYAEKETEFIPDPEGHGRICSCETGRFVFKRGYDKLIAGKQVLVVEDVLTTGGSARKVVEATRAIGGNVVGLSVLCNRGGITPQEVADVPTLTALVNVKLDAWDEDECTRTGPCSRGVSINTDVGKGREFLARKGG